MRKALGMLAVLTCFGNRLCAAEEITVPSGQPITFVDIIRDAPGPDGLTYRFRFLAPEIARAAGKVSGDQAADDMAALCDSYVLPRLANVGPVPSQIIVSLSDRPVPFGTPDPEVTQFFEAFSIADGACVWDGF